jgi:hypothetical protein
MEIETRLVLLAPGTNRDEARISALRAVRGWHKPALHCRSAQRRRGAFQEEPFTEKDAGILASYLTKIRRDGVAKHADMKQRLDQLAENNTALVTLIKAYSLVA